MTARAPELGSLEDIAQIQEQIDEIAARLVPAPPALPAVPLTRPVEVATAALCKLIGGPPWETLTDTERDPYYRMTATVLTTWVRARKDEENRDAPDAGTADRRGVPADQPDPAAR